MTEILYWKIRALEKLKDDERCLRGHRWGLGEVEDGCINLIRDEDEDLSVEETSA